MRVRDERMGDVFVPFSGGTPARLVKAKGITGTMTL